MSPARLCARPRAASQPAPRGRVTPAYLVCGAARCAEMVDALIALRQDNDAASERDLIQRGFSQHEIDVYGRRAVAEAARRERAADRRRA